jgi:predicted N-acetyltransferase YhbS
LPDTRARTSETKLILDASLCKLGLSGFVAAKSTLALRRAKRLQADLALIAQHLGDAVHHVLEWKWIRDKGVAAEKADRANLAVRCETR